MKKGLKNDLEKDVQQKNLRAIGTSSDEVSPGLYQLGGVALFSRRRVVEQINKSGMDPTGMGRWCYKRLSGQFDKHIWIIAAYRVCQMTTAGTETAYGQQLRILSRQG
eukprot:15336187-Ditylum_brightwellii.AAC.1